MSTARGGCAGCRSSCSPSSTSFCTSTTALGSLSSKCSTPNVCNFLTSVFFIWVSVFLRSCFHWECEGTTKLTHRGKELVLISGNA
eukprot:6471239-Amphidinium_carterae.2